MADRKLKVAEKDCAKEEKFKAAIEAVRLELATLKESVEGNQSNVGQSTELSPGYQHQQWNQGPIGCPSCQAGGRGELRNHCYVRGSSDHWARGCHERYGSSEKSGQGNRHWLQPRDRK